METKALMIDLECLSLRPNAYVLQVGFCAAVLETREYIVPPTSMLTHADGQEKATYDFDTVAWWMEQDRVVSGPIFDRQAKRYYSHHIHAELQRIYRFLGEDATVWANPSAYDFPILRNYLKSTPWSFRQERDLMTLGKIRDKDCSRRPVDNAAKHDAAADARWQMEYLFNLS